MPQKTVSQGDTIRLIQGTPGNLYFVEANGDIRLAQTQQFARLARVLPANLDAEVTIREAGVVYAYGEEQATITYDRQGLSWQPRTGQGVVEVNEDQTATISAGGQQTSTVQAGDGEIWVLRAFGFEFTPSNTAFDGGAGDGIKVTVQTEAEDIEIGFVEAANIDQGETLFYDSSGWRYDGASGSISSSRDNIGNENRIDDTNGVDVVVESPDNDMSGTREIRLGFDVIRA